MSLVDRGKAGGELGNKHPSCLTAPTLLHTKITAFVNHVG